LPGFLFIKLSTKLAVSRVLYQKSTAPFVVNPIDNGAFYKLQSLWIDDYVNLTLLDVDVFVSRIVKRYAVIETVTAFAIERTAGFVAQGSKLLLARLLTARSTQKFLNFRFVRSSNHNHLLPVRAFDTFPRMRLDSITGRPDMQPTLKSAQQTFEYMQERLGTLIPELELRHKAELVFEINELKRQKDAIILGHNYMEPALYHMVADFTGDSLELARKATQVDQSTIVFCGVHFMAETAKILNPSKRVLIPSDRAGCSLASSITAEDVRAVRAEFPDVPVVTYVNSTAAVKAESDACCTSGNAVEIVTSFGTDSIIFLPDEYLAKNVAKETGKDIIFPLKHGGVASSADFKHAMVSWHGKCEVHEQFSVQDIKDVRQQYPDVVVLAHPECSPEVTAAADFAGSTKRMIDYVAQTKAPRYLILTECAMGDNIMAAHPEKEVLRMCSVRCPHMNQISLEQTKRCLEQGTFDVEVAEPIRSRAKAALDYMLLH